MIRLRLPTFLAALALALPLGGWNAGAGRAAGLVPAAGPLAGVQVYGNSHALIVGVNEYAGLDRNLWLNYAVKDAEDLRQVLTSHYGFAERNITILTNAQATKQGIENALANYADPARVGPEDRILVYFSGHGQTVKLPTGGEMGFLLPADAKVDLANSDNAAPFLRTCLRMDTVWGFLESSPAKHALLVADACYSGLLASQRSAAEKIPPDALRSLVARRAMQVLTAGRKGEKSLELPALGHGAFTYKLLEELRARAVTPGDVFTVQDLFIALMRSVGNVTDGKQTPQLAARNTEGEFVFITAGETAPGPVAPPVAPPVVTTPPPVPVTPVEVATTARIEVRSAPAGAQVYVNDVEQAGLTPCTVTVDLGRFRNKQVEVALELDGYAHEVRAVNLARQQVVPLDVILQRRGTPPPPPPVEPVQPPAQPLEEPGETPATKARLDVRTTPAGAAVLVDGVPQPKPAPCTVLIEVGMARSKRVDVTLRLRGYQEVAQTITVRRLEPTLLEVPLEKDTSQAPVESEMVLVPAGDFTMGMKTRTDDLKPHLVPVAAFYIDKCEVTNTEYARFLNEAGGVKDAQGNPYVVVNAGLQLEQIDGKWEPKAERARHPAVNVTWFGALAYAQWAGKRLPTEAEWEKAARGADGRRYPWGSDWDPKRCNWDEGGAEDGFDGTSPVGSFPNGASPYGCLDMAGNVLEWVSSLFKPYPYNTDDNRENLSAVGFLDLRILRGGSWRIDEPDFLDGCVRLKNEPSYCNDRTGFRCAKSAE